MGDNGVSNESKVIITTSSKVRLLKSLGEFWSLKSLFIQAKNNPLLVENPDFQKKTLHYFETNSNLSEQTFWINLSQEAKLKATQYFVLQEIFEQDFFRINPDNAAVYLILNGNAKIKATQSNRVSTEAKTYGNGDIFGSIDEFDELAYDMSYGSNFKAQDLAKRTGRIITGKVSRGSYLRLSMLDFFQHILHTDQEQQQLQQLQQLHYQSKPPPHLKAMMKISEMKWQELTDLDRFFVHIFQQTKRLMNRDLFSLLDSYRMIPRNSKMMAATKYYKVGNIGDNQRIKASDDIYLYFFLDGGVKVDIVLKKKHRQRYHPQHVLAYQRNGKRTMAIQKSTMPLLRLQAGALLCLQRNCFQFGHPMTVSGNDDETINGISRGGLASSNSKNSKKSPDPADISSTDNKVTSVAAANNNGKFQETGSVAGSNASSYQGKRSPSILKSNTGTNNTTIEAGMSVSHEVTTPATANVKRLGNDPSHRKSMTSGALAGLIPGLPRAIISPEMTNVEKQTMLRNLELSCPYYLQLHFESETPFLCVPYAAFEKILDDEKLLLKKIAQEIKVQFRFANDIILNRLKALDPWISGSLSLDIPPGVMEAKHLLLPIMEMQAPMSSTVGLSQDALDSEDRFAISGSFLGPAAQYLSLESPSPISTITFVTTDTPLMETTPQPSQQQSAQQVNRRRACTTGQRRTSLSVSTPSKLHHEHDKAGGSVTKLSKFINQLKLREASHHQIRAKKRAFYDSFQSSQQQVMADDDEEEDGVDDFLEDIMSQNSQSNIEDEEAERLIMRSKQIINHTVPSSSKMINNGGKSISRTGASLLGVSLPEEPSNTALPIHNQSLQSRNSPHRLLRKSFGNPLITQPVGIATSNVDVNINSNPKINSEDGGYPAVATSCVLPSKVNDDVRPLHRLNSPEKCCMENSLDSFDPLTEDFNDSVDNDEAAKGQHLLSLNKNRSSSNVFLGSGNGRIDPQLSKLHIINED